MDFINEHLDNLKRGSEELHSQTQSHVEQLGDEATFADRFMLLAAQKQHTFLQQIGVNDAPLTAEELEAQEVAPHLRIGTASQQTTSYDARAIITGEPISGHEVQIRFLGQFFVHLQDVTNALAQALSFNATNKGRIQQSIVGNNRLLLTGIFGGSFGVDFRVAPNNEGEQSSLFQGESELSNESLEQLRRLLDGDVSNASLVEILTHPRVKTHYQSLIDLIAKRGANVSFATRSQTTPSRISTEQARFRLQWLENLQISDEVRPMYGTIVGGSLERNRFELRLDKDKNSLIEGRMSVGAASAFESINLGREVRAVVRVSTSTNEETGQEKISYFLESFSLPEESLF